MQEALLKTTVCLWLFVCVYDVIMVYRLFGICFMDFLSNKHLYWLLFVFVLLCEIAFFSLVWIMTSFKRILSDLDYQCDNLIH